MESYQVRAAQNWVGAAVIAACGAGISVLDWPFDLVPFALAAGVTVGLMVRNRFQQPTFESAINSITDKRAVSVMLVGLGVGLLSLVVTSPKVAAQNALIAVGVASLIVAISLFTKEDAD